MATRISAAGWIVGACCALGVMASPAGARAQAGVLVRGFSSQVHCSPGPDHTVIDGSCAGFVCDAGRSCVELRGVGARCIDPSSEIVCVAGTGGCDDCPMNATTGADPEACRVVTLVEGAHTLCFFDPRLVCLADPAFTFDADLCVPGTENEPDVASGDCDGDGVANAEDACICEHGVDAACRMPAEDAGVVDAGAVDAGGLDSGAADGGAVDDGGGVDGALPDRDGSPSLDAAVPRTLAFGGGGGCVCSAAGSESGFGSAWLAMLALSVAFAFARRR